MIKVSIIVLNFNQFQLTIACLRSIYQFTKGVDFEIILVDNASKECDPQKFLEHFPTIHLLVNEHNTGFAAGNNAGIAKATGDMILLLNNDTILMEDSISYCAQFLHNVQEEAVVTCKLIYPDGFIQKQCSRFPGIALNLLEMFRFHKLLSSRKRSALLLSSYSDHEHTIQPDWFWGTFFMFNQKVLSRLPLQKLNDDFFMYGEDMRWCYDFQKIGVKRVYLPQVKIIHHLGQSAAPAVRANYIAKHEILFLRETRGRLYQVAYTLIRSLNLLLSFNRSSFKNIRYLLKNI